jgi:hypothetical protein
VIEKNRHSACSCAGRPRQTTHRIMQQRDPTVLCDQMFPGMGQYQAQWWIKSTKYLYEVMRMTSDVGYAPRLCISVCMVTPSHKVSPSGEAAKSMDCLGICGYTRLIPRPDHVSSVYGPVVTTCVVASGQSPMQLVLTALHELVHAFIFALPVMQQGTVPVHYMCAMCYLVEWAYLSDLQLQGERMDPSDVSHIAYARALVSKSAQIGGDVFLRLVNTVTQRQGSMFKGMSADVYKLDPCNELSSVLQQCISGRRLQGTTPVISPIWF